MADRVSCMRPRLIVFDLDYTLWPFWVDTHIRCPLKKRHDGTITDGFGQDVKYYPQVPNILERLTSEGIILAVASRTETPDRARQLMKLFGWEKYFRYQEIYPGKKTTHFQRIKEKSGVDFSEMMFLDDENRNITDIRALGVTSLLVMDGVNNAVIERAFKRFAEEHAKT